MDLILSGGTVRRGTYGRITVRGDCSFESGVRFGQCQVSGNLSAPDLAGTSLDCVQGSITCHGSVNVKRIQGRGMLRVDGAVRCQSMEFIGDISVQGDLACAGMLEVHGSLGNAARITAKHMSLVGVLRGRDLHVGIFRIEPFRAVFLSRHGLHGYEDFSHVERVLAVRVDASNLHCTLIQADSVTLHDQCQVEKVSYRHTFVHDRSSSIMSIDIYDDGRRDAKRA